MRSSRPLSNLLQNDLKLLSQCPFCDTPYLPLQAKLLGEEAQTHLVHIRCQMCTNAILAVVVVNPSGMSSMGMMTDLSYEEVIQFSSSRPIVLDDVIRTHEWVQSSQWMSSPSSVKNSPRHSSKRRTTTSPSQKKS